jgi:hydroxymethylglutaryl-CoA reductase
MQGSSRIPEFYKKTPKERIEIVKKMVGLTDEEVEILQKTGSLDIETANRMVENVIGALHLPLGLGLNFLINGKDYLIPMAIEEPSVIAAASNAAKLCRESGGIKTSSTDPVMIGQIQIVKIPDIEKAKKNIELHKKDLMNLLNDVDSTLIKFGGGPRDIQVRVLNTKRGKMLIVHILVDVKDAMGANAVNSMAEKISPKLEELTGGEVLLKIISNLAVYRMARAKAVWTKKALEESLNGKMKGEEIVDAILDAYAFAEADPYRCATHNKGIMNGIDAVAIATGNDFRAVEAGAHAYAAMNGYKPLTKYSKNENGDLVGEIELPIAVGIIGGSIKTNPIANISLKILGVKSSKELAEIMAAVGLAQNFAALRALATEGIQKGHMKLHAKNIAIMAGAKGKQIDIVANKMIEKNEISVAKAKEILSSL